MVGMFLAAAVAVSSQVTDVTVYNDRAQVVRTARAELKEGFNTLRFEGLPEAIDSRGIQVDGSGDATVLDVRFRIEDLNEIPRDAWKDLYDERDTLQLREKKLAQRIDVLVQAKSLLSKIGSKVTHTAERESEPELDPAQWEKMLLLYTDKSTEYNEAILAAESELNEVREALVKIQEVIQARGADSRKKQRVVEVDVEAAKAGSAELRLSYLVRGPGWVPTYDIRVDSEARTLEVKYFALVRQNTGEDWSGVALRLSTANPGLGGRHPELQPWRIGMFTPRQVSKVSSISGSVGDKSSAEWNAFGLDSATENRYAVADLEGISSITAGVRYDMAQPQPDVQHRETVARRQGASVVFDVPGASSVESDNVEHRVAVAAAALPAAFRYSAIPKLDPYAYLKAKAVNGSEYPFLEGKANVYLDGSFVTTSAMELVAPGEEFWVFLGADESIKVEHRLVRRYQSREGLGGRYVRHSYEYMISVKNNHGVPEEMIVWDQVPISGSEGLEVKLLEPKYSKETDALKIDDEQRISWFRTLQPGEEWAIPFSFQVEHPRDMTVQGL